jgi:hypothetical protein
MAFRYGASGSERQLGRQTRGVHHLGPGEIAHAVEGGGEVILLTEGFTEVQMTRIRLAGVCIIRNQKNCRRLRLHRATHPLWLA